MTDEGRMYGKSWKGSSFWRQLRRKDIDWISYIDKVEKNIFF
jgi:hypothetical protein